MENILVSFTMENGFLIPVKVFQTGAYKAIARIASEQTGGEFHLSLNGEDITATQSITGQLVVGQHLKIIQILTILFLKKENIF